MSAPLSRGPASVITSLTPFCASRESRAKRSTLPSGPGRQRISAPAASSAAAFFASGAAQAMRVLASSRMAASAGVRRRESTTTLIGWRVVSRPRTFSLGSSASTVSMPVRMAQERARSRCTSRRAASPVIHFDSPEDSAVLPSSEEAVLIRTKGWPSSMRLKKPALSSRASASSSPLWTSMPAARMRARPSPATLGLGSWAAATTRATPAPMSASAQGGVRPWCAQGSRLTYTVAPCAAGPACISAWISACASPAFWCQPSPMILPSLTMTQPTRGLGEVV